MPTTKPCAVTATKGQAMTVNVRKRKSTSGKVHWQADIHITLPNGQVVRERRMAQGTTKAAALRWAKARHAHLLRHGKEKQPDRLNTTPTLGEFVEQFRRDYLIANRWRPSTLYTCGLPPKTWTPGL